jgi:rare lipoprotein A
MGRRVRACAWLVLSASLLAACSRDIGPSAPSSARQRQRAGTAVGCSAKDMAAPARDVQEGYASYYANSLAGNRTASGERYDPRQLTAAHRKLPFGTRLRVSRTDVAAPIVCVTVNDRGPFAGRRRVIDLSRRSAEAIDMIRAGVVPVRIEIL